MAKKEEVKHKEDKLFEKVVIAACVVSIAIAVIVLFLNKDEPYSVIYIKSYSNYAKENFSFTYVVESHETKSSMYEVGIFLGNSSVQNDSFQLDAGNTERTVNFPVSNETQFPAKVEAIATVNNRNYSVHFWLSGFGG
jgi:hypothetical protein